MNADQPCELTSHPRLELRECAIELRVQPIDPILYAIEPMIDAVEAMVYAIEPMIDAVEAMVYAIDPILYAFEPMIDTIEPMIDAIESMIDAIEPMIDAIKPIVHGIEPAVRARMKPVDVVEACVRDSKMAEDAGDTIFDAMEPGPELPKFTGVIPHPAFQIGDPFLDRWHVPASHPPGHHGPILHRRGARPVPEPDRQYVVAKPVRVYATFADASLASKARFAIDW